MNILPVAALLAAGVCPTLEALRSGWIEHRGPVPQAVLDAHLASPLDDAAPLLLPVKTVPSWLGLSRRGRGPTVRLECFARGSAALYYNGPDDAPAVDFVSRVAAGEERALGAELLELRWLGSDGRKHRWFNEARAARLGWKEPTPLPQALNELL